MSAPTARHRELARRYLALPERATLWSDWDLTGDDSRVKAEDWLASTLAQVDELADDGEGWLTSELLDEVDRLLRRLEKVEGSADLNVVLPYHQLNQFRTLLAAARSFSRGFRPDG